MRVEHPVSARACAAAIGALLAAADGLTDEDLLAPSRCRGWSRLDTLVHVHLGLQEMLLGVVSPTDAEPDVDAVSYWRSDPPGNDDSADAIDQIGYLHRLSSAYRRPGGAVGHLRITAETLAQAVERMPEGRVRFQGHVLDTGDFLATWATELAVHHLDLDLDADAPRPDPGALRLARRTAEALAGRPIEAATDAEATLRGWDRVG
ncbi:MAG TPA: maleylpyruvate isomerase N-terminal domain-containing protein [Propionibacteriaceae bacterium]|nr:maleylpyruvate isomerase N-terminal domain-containing protein [Propionibacteriaceae bacterium]